MVGVAQGLQVVVDGVADVVRDVLADLLAQILLPERCQPPAYREEEDSKASQQQQRGVAVDRDNLTGSVLLRIQAELDGEFHHQRPGHAEHPGEEDTNASTG